MISNLITSLTRLIISVISTSGYAGIFGLMTLESALIPIPSEVTMSFSGYLVSTGRFSFIAVVIVGALANLFGSILAYLLGYWGEEAIVLQVIKKYGKYFLISEHEYRRSEKWFRVHGEKIVFLSRVLPVLRTFISLPAGIAKMNFVRFCIYTFTGSFIWSAVLTYIGMMLGRNWNSIDVYFKKFQAVVIILIVALVAYYIWHKIKSSKK